MKTPSVRVNDSLAAGQSCKEQQLEGMAGLLAK